MNSISQINLKRLKLLLFTAKSQRSQSIKEHCQILFIFTLSLSSRSLLRLCGELLKSKTKKPF